MAIQDQHLCGNCGNPDPLEHPFCGFCGHPNDQIDVRVSVAPSEPGSWQAPNGQGVDEGMELDPDVWGDLVADPTFTEGPVNPVAAAAAAAASAVQDLPEQDTTSPTGTPAGPLTYAAPVSPVPPVTAFPATGLPAGSAAGQPSRRNRSRMLPLLAVGVVVLIAIAVTIVVVSGGSHKGGKGSGKEHATTTLAPAHAGSTSPGTAPKPSHAGFVAGTSSDPWVAQTIPSGVVTNLYDISCASTEACWAVGSNDLTKTYCTAGCSGSAIILATHDGGKTWGSQPYPTNTGLGSNGYLFSVSCGSPSTCLAGGSGDRMAILSTDDGGSTWVSDPYPSGLAGGHIFQVDCVSANNCWALGGESTTPFILATTNGGQSWSEQQFPSGLGVGANGLHTISCATTSRCVIAAESGGSLLILATSNGGSSWSVQPYPSTISAKADALGYVSCPTQNSCYITGYNTSTSGGAPVILATHDGGATWVSDSYPSSLGLTKLNWVKCSDGSHCWAVGSATSGAVMLATADGGSHWATQSMPSGLGLGSQGLADVACPKTSACWAIGTGNSNPVILAARR